MRRSLFNIFKHLQKAKPEPEPELSPIVAMERDRLKEVQFFGHFTTLRDFLRLIAGDSQQYRMDLTIALLKSINAENLDKDLGD